MLLVVRTTYGGRVAPNVPISGTETWFSAQRLQQYRFERLVGAVDLVDEQHHRFSERIASSSGRGARKRSEKNTLSCAPIRSTASFRSGASATIWPIFSRRIWV